MGLRRMFAACRRVYPRGMTYARARLWLGISGVGLQVVAACVALYFGLPVKMLRGHADVVAICSVLLVYVLLSIPSDLLGGYYLPRVHGRSGISVSHFAVGWVRGVLAQAFVVGLSAAALLGAGRLGGVWAGVGAFFVVMVLLLAVQGLVARLVAGFKCLAVGAGAASGGATLMLPPTGAPIAVAASAFSSSDPGFVGGLVGLPGMEHLVIPERWFAELPAEVLKAEMTRRQGVLETGARTRGIFVALFWNVLGFALALHMPGASLMDAAGLVQAGLWFTLWSFAGLLLLPSVTKPGVLEADQFALAHGVSAETLAAMISRLDGLQDDEPTRGRWVERVFHPIPSVNARLAALRGSETHYGAWQGARVTLYLSWACFGFLSRAVHCNAGRPELWVLFPGD